MTAKTRQLQAATDVTADPGNLLVGTVPSGRTQPGLPLSEAQVSEAIATAARAPSLHNTQPWRFRVAGHAIDLLADDSRQLRELDPSGRELTISCGAALFGLRLGLRRLGLVPQAELLPASGCDQLLARVRAVGLAAPTSSESELVAAVPHRHTHRGPFSPGEISARLLAVLRTDAVAEGAELRLVTRPEALGLVELVVQAAAAQEADPGLAAELLRWVQPSGSTARDGVPARARVGSEPAGVWPGSPHVSPVQPRLPSRDFGQPGAESGGGAPPSATAVLVTRADTVADWLRAGQALHRVLLRAATRWVFASLQSQPLESEAHREQVRVLLGLAGQPQMLMQLGRSNSAAATPRRPQSEIRVPPPGRRPT